MTWTHRERVLAALDHEEPDRVPIDLGAAEFTSITLAAYEKLKLYLGVTTETVPMSIMPVPRRPTKTLLASTWPADSMTRFPVPLSPMTSVFVLRHSARPFSTTVPVVAPSFPTVPYELSN